MSKTERGVTENCLQDKVAYVRKRKRKGEKKAIDLRKSFSTIRRLKIQKDQNTDSVPMEL